MSCPPVEREPYWQISEASAVADRATHVPSQRAPAENHGQSVRVDELGVGS
jgi:hypothetical protein